MVEEACVWSVTGEQLEFTQAAEAGFSTLSMYSGKANQRPARATPKTYSVETVSLHDLLIRCNAPRSIDYMSIDTEGSEYDILSGFPFDRWDIACVTVEHNFRDDRCVLQHVMKANGFVRILPKLSKFDDWYVAERLMPRVAAVFDLKG